MSGGYVPTGSGGYAGGYPSAPPGNYQAPPTNFGPPGAPGGGALQGAMKGMPDNIVNDIFFAAACCIMSCSLVSGIVLFFHLDLLDFIHMTYLMIFGGTLAILDTPFFKTIKAVMDAKMYIGKYVQFVTRVTGKGVTFVFLGVTLWVTLWYNLERGLPMFLAVISCLFPALVGFAAIVIGVLKSSKLDSARRQVQVVIDQRYAQFAQTYPGPQGGLTMAEFQMLTRENGGFEFESLDLKLIFNALVSNPSWRAQPTSTRDGYVNVNDTMKIPRQDLLDWCKDGWVFL